jgi:hypothetical protein
MNVNLTTEVTGNESNEDYNEDYMEPRITRAGRLNASLMTKRVLLL